MASFIGGIDIKEDRQKIAHCRTIVGTPGRILHLINSCILNTEKIKLLVLDEADKLMCDTFQSDIDAICRHLPAKRQCLAVSATFDYGLDRLLSKYMKSPIGVTPHKDAPILLGVKQFCYDLSTGCTDPNAITTTTNSVNEMQAKVKALQTVFGAVPFKQCLVFSNSQSRAESYCNYLTRSGWPADVITGGQEQKVRLDVFRKFKRFQCRILVSTDLMARGIDSENVNLVINVDVPTDSSVYLHRIGRCGRFGSQGIAITMTANDDAMMRFCRLLGNLGGSAMRVLKFDSKKVTDIWTATVMDRAKEAEMFGEICGIDEVSTAIHLELDKVKGTQHGLPMKTSAQRPFEISDGADLAMLKSPQFLNDERPEPDNGQRLELKKNLSPQAEMEAAITDTVELALANIANFVIDKATPPDTVGEKLKSETGTQRNSVPAKRTEAEIMDTNLALLNIATLLIDKPTNATRKTSDAISVDDVFENYSQAIADKDDLFDNYSMAVNCSTISAAITQNENESTKLPAATGDAANAVFLEAIARLNLYTDESKPLDVSDLSTSVKETVGSSTPTSRKSASTGRGKVLQKDTSSSDESMEKINGGWHRDLPENSDETECSDDESSVFVDCETSDDGSESECIAQEDGCAVVQNGVDNSRSKQIWHDQYYRQMHQITDYVNYVRGRYCYE